MRVLDERGQRHFIFKRVIAVRVDILFDIDPQRRANRTRPGQAEDDARTVFIENAKPLPLGTGLDPMVKGMAHREMLRESTTDPGHRVEKQ